MRTHVGILHLLVKEIQWDTRQTDGILLSVKSTPRDEDEGKEKQN